MSTTVTLVGNLTRDPELRFTSSGKAVCAFSMAVNRGKDLPGEFFDITAWDDLGTNVADSLEKGDRVMVSGRLSYRSWETDDGSKRSKVEVVAYEVGPSLRWATVEGIKRLTKGGGGGPEYTDDEAPSTGASRSKAAPKQTYDYGEEPF